MFRMSQSFKLSTVLQDFVTYGDLRAFFNAQVTTNGPLGSPFLQVNTGSAGWADIAIPNAFVGPTLFLGQRVMPCSGSGTGSVRIQFISPNSLVQFQVVINLLMGSISVYSGGEFNNFTPLTNAVLLGTTSPNIINPSSWMFLEIGATISPTVGAVQLRVGEGPGNGTVQVLNLSNVNTQADAASSGFAILAYDNGGFNPGWFGITHIYLNDATGPAPWNTFLNDVIVTSLEPVANDAVQFTPVGQAANWQNAIVVPPVPGSDYNSDAALGQQDTYTVAALPPTVGVVYAVTTVALMGKGDSGPRSMASVLKSGATTVINASTAMATTPQAIRAPAETDPNTGFQWLPANMIAGDIKIGAHITY